jgi:hypothetical protein
MKSWSTLIDRVTDRHIRVRTACGARVCASGPIYRWPQQTPIHRSRGCCKSISDGLTMTWLTLVLRLHVIYALPPHLTSPPRLMLTGIKRGLYASACKISRFGAKINCRTSADVRYMLPFDRSTKFWLNLYLHIDTNVLSRHCKFWHVWTMTPFCG